RELIRAYFYEGDKWVPKVAKYPGAIIDRLKARGQEEAKIIYEDLNDVPFTNNWTMYSIRRSEIHKILQASEFLIDVLADIQKVLKPRNVFQFIEKYQRVLLKPESMLDPTYFIMQSSNSNYTVWAANEK